MDFLNNIFLVIIRRLPRQPPIPFCDVFSFRRFIY
ncbi:unnamed protein product [Acanthoscelides obtectus]|uniref:Uncharacterized protein n=1 Tax=Acanthoscelides obtectus TaxID=200917 RepID=A0A9P0PYF8_ACAOB|nr:unnamed protein product [Acanthoscelides obtectus]CAK1678424.1 hypothetical protein AOBTE_LOCUS31895 [Acanthoscelides obtectus]